MHLKAKSDIPKDKRLFLVKYKPYAKNKQINRISKNNGDI